MHILKPKHVKLNKKEAEEVLKRYNVSKSQLPRILLDDPGLPEGCNVGDIIRIERKNHETGEITVYYRVVV
jgi:DNA-directed RNA polymerase subunit H (RpoH/RPB5)